MSRWGHDGAAIGEGPLVQYLNTADGFSIAYWTLGEGPPIVQLPEQFIRTAPEFAPSAEIARVA